MEADFDPLGLGAQIPPESQVRANPEELRLRYRVVPLPGTRSRAQPKPIDQKVRPIIRSFGTLGALCMPPNFTRDIPTELHRFSNPGWLHLRRSTLSTKISIVHTGGDIGSLPLLATFLRIPCHPARLCYYSIFINPLLFFLSFFLPFPLVCCCLLFLDIHGVEGR